MSRIPQPELEFVAFKEKEVELTRYSAVNTLFGSIIVVTSGWTEGYKSNISTESLPVSSSGCDSRPEILLSGGVHLGGAGKSLGW